MKEASSLKHLLVKAARSARIKAARKKQPIAVSENGEIKLLYPNNKEKVIYKSRHKKAS